MLVLMMMKMMMEEDYENMMSIMKRKRIMRMRT